MKVMTYNIRLGIQEGVEAIVEIVAHQEPDVVALQEVGDDWTMGPEGHTAARIAEALDMQHHFVPTIREDDHRYGHALLSHVPITSPEVVSLTQRDDEPRAALLSRLEMADEQLVRVISTHLSHRTTERAVQGRELLDLARDVLDEGHPTLLMGDLNDEVGADWMSALQEVMDDAGVRAPDATFRNPDPTMRIDYILIAGGRVASAEVLDEPTASDHRPVVAEVEFE